jgi:hypothetical protein
MTLKKSDFRFIIYLRLFGIRQTGIGSILCLLTAFNFLKIESTIFWRLSRLSSLPI